MKKFIQPDITPIGGYQFTDPDLPFDYNRAYRNFQELETHVTVFRKQNKLPMLKKFRSIWEAFICENVPLMKSRCCHVEDLVKRSFTQYYKGAKAFFKAAIQKDEAFTTQEEADKRADLCRRCTENVVNIGHKHAQFYSDNFMRLQIGNRKSKYHDALHTCRICSCILKAKVFYDGKIVAESVTDEELGALMRKPMDNTGKYLKCWQLSAFEEHSNGKASKTT